MKPPCVAFDAFPPGGQRQRPGKAGSAAFAGARWSVVVALALLFAVTGSSAQVGSAKNTVPQPVIEAARGGSCVADPATMRRQHMVMLKHQRDDSLRGGIRTGAYSLKACIACHASQSTNSVTASSSNFCQSCHAYAAVLIDCFECHANQPQAKP